MIGEMVSIIIPTYNRFKLVQNAIKSVLNQTYSNFEVIVINDNSSESDYDSFNWDSLNIKYLKTDGRGVCFARNLGISESAGTFVAFLDDDDMWLPEKLTKQMTTLGKLRMSCTDGFYGDKSPVYNPHAHNTVYFKEKYYGYIRRCLGVPSIPPIIRLSHMVNHNIMVTSSVLIDREIVNKCGGFYMSKEHKCEDWPLWIRCLGYTDCGFINEPLFYYNNTKRERNALTRGVQW